jgi:hypothetical protein
LEAHVAVYSGGAEPNLSGQTNGEGQFVGAKPPISFFTALVSSPALDLASPASPKTT